MYPVMRVMHHLVSYSPFLSSHVSHSRQNVLSFFFSLDQLWGMGIFAFLPSLMRAFTRLFRVSSVSSLVVSEGDLLVADAMICTQSLSFSAFMACISAWVCVSVSRIC